MSGTTNTGPAQNPQVRRRCQAPWARAALAHMPLAPEAISESMKKTDSTDHELRIGPETIYRSLLLREGLDLHQRYAIQLSEDHSRFRKQFTPHRARSVAREFWTSVHCHTCFGCHISQFV